MGKILIVAREKNRKENEKKISKTKIRFSQKRKVIGRNLNEDCVLFFIIKNVCTIHYKKS